MQGRHGQHHACITTTPVASPGGAIVSIPVHSVFMSSALTCGVAGAAADNWEPKTNAVNRAGIALEEVQPNSTPADIIALFELGRSREGRGSVRAGRD